MLAALISASPNSPPSAPTLEMTTSTMVCAVSVSRIRYSPASPSAGRLTRKPTTVAKTIPMTRHAPNGTPCFCDR